MQSKRRKKLKEIKYKVLKCCGLCEHGSFLGAADVGVCSLQRLPAPRTGAPQPLPINRYATCMKFTKRIPVQLGWWGTTEVPQPSMEEPTDLPTAPYVNGAVGKNLSLF